MTTPASDVKRMVNQQFSQVAANYSVSAVHAQGVDLQEMVRQAQLGGHERVLDAGCGAGHTALAFAAVAREVVAVDLSAAMLEQCRRLAAARTLSNVDFRVGDVEELAFAEGDFDVVTSRYSAHHWPHPQQALHEIARVLKPGGQFLLGDIISYADFSMDTFLQAIELLRDPSHVRDHTAAQWLEMLAAAGFDASVVFTWDVRLDFADWVQRMQTPPTYVAALRALLDGAPMEIRDTLRVEADHSFTLRGALLRGWRR
jgi:ubiquinone/menaquinone biosynthesis C-methylase UbiE